MTQSSEHFFAVLSRMKYITRWGLMRCTTPENLSEHSLETAILAHALAVLENTRFGGAYSPEKAAVLALFHDTSEIFTGDLPTPVKYFNPEISEAYHAVEDSAREHLLSLLPEDLYEVYRPLLLGEESEAEWALVHAADKLSALIKCLEEQKAGNREFDQAAETLRRTVVGLGMKSVDCFMEEFLPSYLLSLDEQNAFR